MAKEIEKGQELEGDAMGLLGALAAMGCKNFTMNLRDRQKYDLYVEDRDSRITTCH